MLRNEPHLFHNNHHDDNEAITVQVSDANSHLGHLLLEADWTEVSAHLATPEGQRDVDARNDPLGLFNGQQQQPHVKNKLVHLAIPSSKNTAFFAALFVRAPYDVIQLMFTKAPSHVDQPEDLMYVLSVVPSEEEMHSQEMNRKVPFRTRAWTSEEYNRILNLLIQSFVSSKSPSSSLLNYMAPWAIASSHYSLTPLAIAAYNPDVTADILQLVCTLETRAMERECKIIGHPTLPLILAAASPLPPEHSSAIYNDAKDLRWKKVKLLTLSEAWYEEQHKLLLEAGESGDNKQELTPPEPTIHEIQLACEEAMRRNEWELVREFLKQCNTGETKVNGDAAIISMLEPIQTSLVQHDEKVHSTLQQRRQSKEKKRARDEWLHNNMGLVKYPIDTLLDLVSVVIPGKKHDDEMSNCIVAPMSRVDQVHKFCSTLK